MKKKMKNWLRFFGIIALAAMIGFSFISCGDTVSGPGTSGGGQPDTNQPGDDGGTTGGGGGAWESGNVDVTGVSLNRSATTILVGETETLFANVEPSNATNRYVNWSSSNTAIATVTSGGVVRGVAAGTARITVTTVDGGRTASANVTVSATAIAVTGVSLPASISLNVGGTQTLTPTITPSTATNQNVSWSSSNSGVATVSAGGLVTAVAAGTATITVTTADGGRTASANVTVTQPTVTFNSVTANGSATQATTQLTLTFSQAVPGLTASDITLSGVPGVTRGTLSGTGPTYTLNISGFSSGGTLTVAVARAGVTINNPSRTVTIHGPPAISFNNVTANGSATQATTQLTLTFSQAVPGLTASDITLSGVPGVTRGTLSGTGPTYTLNISGFSSGGTLTVAVARAGVTITNPSRTVPIHGPPPTSPYADFIWTAAGGVKTITGWRGTGNAVTIPASIYGVPVTTIGERVFWNNQLTSVAIPSSVTYIGAHAFEHNRLISVTIPNSVTVIEDSAFASNRLTNVTIPSSVTHIWHRAFANNELTSVTIPNSVTVINPQSFANNRLTSVTIPSSVTDIANGAFANNRLTSVTIPSSVTHIWHSAFASNQLTSVTIPSSVTQIAHEAFANNRLTSVIIPSSVIIWQNAFSFNQLTSVSIGSLAIISTDAFNDGIYPGFPSGFVEAYNDGGWLAGTYRRPNTASTVWTRQ